MKFGAGFGDSPLEISITGRHTTITESLKNHAHAKLEKLERFADGIEDVRLILNVEENRQTAECIFRLRRHGQLVSEAEADDLYAAIDMAADRMARQLKKHKGKDHAARHKDGLGLESAHQQEANQRNDEEE